MSETAKQDQYWEVLALLGPDTAELWSHFCFERGAGGCEEIEEGGRLVAIRAFFEQPPQMDSWAEAFRQDYPDAPPPTQVTVAQKPVENWALSWRDHFHPLPVGQRLVITPPWAVEQAAKDYPGRVAVQIEPGMGFGTGSHATTALALTLLERQLGQAVPESMVDVGCGSAILAVAAGLLGVGRITAIDNDPLVEEDVGKNFALNRLPAPTLLIGSPEALQGQWPLVVANITAPVLIRLSPDLYRITAPGGTLILSGILPHEAPQVESCFTGLGLKVAGQAESGPGHPETWRGFIFFRPL